MKRKKLGVVVFVLIAAFCAVLGMRVTESEKQYKSFFIERNDADAVDTPSGEETPNEGAEEQQLMININTDKAYELTLLEGIGEKTAEMIIDYRRKNGDFEVIEDLMRVNGIGEKKFDKIKDNIYVEEKE